MFVGNRLHGVLLAEPRVAEQFAARSQLQAMLAVEVALAEAEAAVGVVPESCVEPIRTAACADLYDHRALAVDVAHVGIPAVGVVRHLTAQVAAADPAAARYVHWGATSQDIMDTGLVLQLRAAVAVVCEHPVSYTHLTLPTKA